ncbi:MAG: ATPase domain-containing protein [Myxococcota bacterium]|nr:ATPase domain-containing protein [Myxococcota bacterium]
MIASRVMDLAVQRLEYVFLPPGLPLVQKAPQGPATTSILVRGGPGVGKTTLAVGLAHAIAREAGGVACYLSTEAAAAELPFKATLLGLRREIVTGWDRRASATPGTIAVQHLALTDAGREATTIAERQRNAVDAAWALVKDAAEHPQGAPVRCLVIDGFAVPDVLKDPGLGREDVAALVQGLEARGASPILIEEAGRDVPDWLSFVTDIVLEMSLDSDPDVGSLRHVVRVSKTRFSLSLAGPHDWGIFENKLTVWPDLLAVAAYSHGNQPAAVQQPARVFLPAEPAGLASPPVDRRLVRLSRNVVFSPLESSTRSLPQVLQATAGVRPLTVRVGPVTAIGGPDENSVELRLPDIEGPFALGWVVASLVAERRANAVVLYHAAGILDPNQTPRAAAHFRRVLHALRELGLLVCVVGPREKCTTFWETVDYAEDAEHPQIDWGLLRPMLDAKLLSAARWITDVSTLPHPDPRSEVEGRCARELADALRVVRGHLDDDRVAEARKVLDDIRIGGMGPAEDRVRMELALVRSLAGQPGQAAGPLATTLSREEPRVATARGWIAALLGLDWLAARVAVAALRSGSGGSRLLLLWDYLCAAYAGNDDALSRVSDTVDTAVAGGEVPLPLPLFLRALVKRGRVSDADRVVELVVRRGDRPPWIAVRLQAEARLAWGKPESWTEAADRLAKLVDDESIPRVHRAEVAFNAGVARERVGGPRAALQWFQRANEMNPNLEPAKDRVAAMGPARAATST